MKVGVSMIDAPASKVVESVEPTKSDETTSSSVEPTMPLVHAFFFFGLNAFIMPIATTEPTPIATNSGKRSCFSGTPYDL